MQRRLKKKIKKAVKPARKIEKKEEPVVSSNEVRFMGKRDWSYFNNCPSTLKVKTRIIEKDTFSGYETFESKISSGSVETVNSEIDTILGEVNTSEGSEVSRGQLLITLDVEDLNKRLENARSSLEEWKKLLADIENWTDRSENLENELKEKIRNISLLIPKLGNLISNANIYSPFDGTVSYIVKAGDKVKAGEILVKIEDNTRVVIPLKVEDISKYDESMKVEAAFEGVEGTFEGKLKISDGILYTVVDNFSKTLTYGMKSKVNILREYRDVIVCNKSEILRDSEGYFGYVVEDRHAKRVALVPGADKGSRIMILSGLEAGDELIISDFNCLEDGKKIKLKYLDAQTGKYVTIRTPDEMVDVSGKLFKKESVGRTRSRYVYGFGRSFHRCIRLGCYLRIF